MMSRSNLTFDEAVAKLFLNIPLNANPVESIISQFESKADSSSIFQRTRSLGISVEMNTDDTAIKSSHVFVFNDIELFDQQLPYCKIQIDVGETSKEKKILDIKWVAEFDYEQQASLFFEKIKDIFTPLSTIHKVEEDKWNEGMFAQFSNRLPDHKGIRDITFFYGKSSNTSRNYEVSFYPQNEFSNE